MPSSERTAAHSASVSGANRCAPSNSILLTGPIASTLFNKSLPVIAGMIAMMLFNLVDAWFVSRLGTAELAAVSFTFPVSFAAISLAIGLGIGTSAVVGRRLGRGEVETVRRRATDAFLLSLLVGIIVSVAGLMTVSPLFTALGADQTLMPHIHAYMGVWYFGAAFVIAPRVLNSVLRAQGNTLIPGLLMGAAALLNALLDPLLIFGLGPVPGLGVSGAALATVISWGVMTLGLFAQRDLKALIDLRGLTFPALMASWTELGKIALPAAITSVFTPIAMALVTRIVADYGHAAVAAFGVGTRIDAIAQIVVLALSMTLSPFISQNQGADQPERVRRAILGCFAFVLVWQLLIWGVLQGLAPWLSESYAQTPEVGEVLRTFLWLVPLGLGAQGVVILTNSSFNALHRPRRALVLSVIRLFVLFVPLAWLGGRLAGPMGIFAGMLGANVIMAVISWRQIRSVLSHRLGV
ncbi:MATE family efflux transporter [Modicisalibacter luteus]|uniref:MATE family efflux transporter n=1 Tax=Modicisalibacter luteus TaxID=453962 RepID=A0ABV7M3K6_9GAMM|nr:MATE family efflux transporter [Halomonas lutea]GHA83989.1 MATE family efflux transporter [Halomonas lutea]